MRADSGKDGKPRDAILHGILKAVCKAAGVTEEEMCGQSRKAMPAAARHVFCFHAAEKGFTRTETGRIINRNYSTVIHSLKTFQSQSGHFPMMDGINNRLNVNKYEKKQTV
jgi:chromosomal replication initiation ATPase DnaA